MEEEGVELTVVVEFLLKLFVVFLQELGVVEEEVGVGLHAQVTANMYHHSEGVEL